MKNHISNADEEIVVFYATGLYYHLDDIKSALSSFTNVSYAQLALDGKPDNLCWKMPKNNLSETTCIWIGDDNQSLFNLSLTVHAKQWLSCDRRSYQIKVVNNPLATNWMRRRNSFVKKCKDAQAIGIVVSTLTADGYLNAVNRIQTLARNQGIRTYLLPVGQINPAKLGNFMEIDCFVFIGCPENSIHTSNECYKLLSVFEAEIAFNPDWRVQLFEFGKRIQSNSEESQQDNVEHQGENVEHLDEIEDSEEACLFCHGTGKQRTCTNCHKICQTFGELEKHRTDQLVYKCSDTQVEEQSTEDEKRCEICQGVVANPEVCSNCQTVESPIQCMSCSRSFSTKELYNKHRTARLSCDVFPKLMRIVGTKETKSVNVMENLGGQMTRFINRANVELEACSPAAVVYLLERNKNLKTLNASYITGNLFSFPTSFALKPNQQSPALKKLRLSSSTKSSGSSMSIENLRALLQLDSLRHLSLTSFESLDANQLEPLASLTALVSLELGKCNNLAGGFAKNILIKLRNLERLRLEDGKGCVTFDILEAVEKLPKLVQLELVNFDIELGFDTRIAQCKRLKRLLIIPTYISQSATTNNLVLSSIAHLGDTLQSVTWVVTQELIRVTDLYTEVHGIQPRRTNEDEIPIKKPVPMVRESLRSQTSSDASPQHVEILPLSRVRAIIKKKFGKLILTIETVPFTATWRHTISEAFQPQPAASKKTSPKKTAPKKTFPTKLG
ncbi:uncharacterized protein LOC129574573 [Sitodiplosis mosellana]|uniref:uncharacterized protein LOC129574573 n=1 Tax=Sitodiplosis mosellana TaxID=263140 RepID=UPI002444B87F|nr:uncharacterized protein LOC129574573 [Sitodiplosis mosellana]